MATNDSGQQKYIRKVNLRVCKELKICKMQMFEYAKKYFKKPTMQVHQIGSFFGLSVYLSVNQVEDPAGKSGQNLPRIPKE